MRTILLPTLAILALNACGPKDDGPPQEIDMQTPVSVARGAPSLKLGETLSLIPLAPGDANTLPVPTDSLCTLPQASAGTKIISITAYDGGANKTSPLFIAHRRGISPRGGPIFDIKSALISHVIITETQAPVYLVLSSNNAVLWSLNIDKDVKIDGVSIISAEPSGLAGVQIDESRIGFITKSKANRRTCWKAPQNYTEQISGQYQFWLSWLSQKIGGEIEQDYGDYSLSAVLIGAAPEKPFRSIPFEGTVYLGQGDDFAFWGTEKQARIKYPGQTK